MNVSFTAEIEAAASSEARVSEPSRRTFLDVGDAIFFLGHHRNVTGIQRVVSMLVATVGSNPADTRSVDFVAFSQSEGRYFLLAKGPTLALFREIQEMGNPDRTMAACLVMANGDYSSLAAVPLNLEGLRGSTICLIGAAWTLGVIPSLRAAKKDYGCKVAILVYDLIPLLFKEFVHDDLTRRFARFVADTASLVDLFLTISDYTARELRAYLEDRVARIPEVRALHLGTFQASAAASRVAWQDLLPTSNYVLYVSTIEVRKNHRLLFDLWQDFLRQQIDVPDLVFVGRIGWKIDDLLQDINSSNYLDGHLHILTNVSDGELAELYTRAAFAVYPSFTEGWGLPVTEALSFGTPVLSSNTTSLPEAGGTVARYLDPKRPEDWRKAILEWSNCVDLRAGIDFTQYEPPSWKTALTQLVGCCQGCAPQAETAPRLLARDIITVGHNRPAAIEDLHTFCAPSSTVADVVLPHEVRLGSNWSIVEEWGTWALRGSFRVCHAVGPHLDEHALVYFLRFPAGLQGEVLSCAINGLRSSFKVSAGKILLGVEGKKLMATDQGADIDLKITIANRAALEPIAATDGRVPCVGLEAITYLRMDDVPAWSTIISNLGSEGRKVVWLRL